MVAIVGEVASKSCDDFEALFPNFPWTSGWGNFLLKYGETEDVRARPELIVVAAVKYPNLSALQGKGESGPRQRKKS